jgi:hypothetical protein
MNSNIYIYFDYIKETLFLYTKLYKELLAFSTETEEGSEKKTDEDFENSSDLIKSIVSTFNKHTLVAGEFLGKNNWAMNHSVFPFSWNQHVTIEIQKKQIMFLKFDIDFFIDFPRENFFMISVNEKGAVSNFIFLYNVEETHVHDMILSPGIKISFSDKVLDIIREENETKGSLEISSPEFFVSPEFFIPRLSFNSLQMFLDNISWTNLVLNSIDVVLKKCHFYLLSYSSNDNSSHLDNNQCPKYYKPSHIQTSNFLFDPKAT